MRVAFLCIDRRGRILILDGRGLWKHSISLKSMEMWSLTALKINKYNTDEFMSK